MVDPAPFIFFCPVCDRKHTSRVSKKDVEDRVKNHVAKQHPNYDPEWFETYPDFK